MPWVKCLPHLNIWRTLRHLSTLWVLARTGHGCLASGLVNMRSTTRSLSIMPANQELIWDTHRYFPGSQRTWQSIWTVCWNRVEIRIPNISLRGSLILYLWNLELLYRELMKALSNRACQTRICLVIWKIRRFISPRWDRTSKGRSLSTDILEIKKPQPRDMFSRY